MSLATKIIFTTILSMTAGSVHADMIVIQRAKPAQQTPQALIVDNPGKRGADQPIVKDNSIQLRQGNLVMVNYDKFPPVRASGSGKKVKTCQAVKLVAPAGFTIECDRNRFNKETSWKSSGGTWLDNLNQVAVQSTADIQIDFKRNLIVVTDHKPGI